MQRTRFRSLAFPADVAGRLRERLVRAHAHQPFSTVDPRETVRRVAGIVEDLGLRATICRGGVDLRGAEADHVWLDVEGRVVDAAFPLLEEPFVALLRRFVAGEASSDELAEAAAGADVERRVLGEFPHPLGYIGAPVWSGGRPPALGRG